MEFIIIDGARMTSVEQAHLYLERTLRLPPHYGRNLDALYDCLTDLPNTVFVVLINGRQMDEQLGEYAARLRRVFWDASNLPYSLRFIENPS